MLSFHTANNYSKTFNNSSELINSLKNYDSKDDPITELYANQGNLKEDQVRDLYNVLKKGHEELKWIDLSDNNFGKTGAIFIGKMFKHLDNLERVDISGNKFGKYVKNIAKYVEKHDNLKVLELSSNEIGNKGADNIGEMIEKSESLEAIFLMDNGITGRGIKKILDGVEGSKSLLMIELSGNDADKASKYVRSMLEKNDVLEELYLDNANLDMRDIERIIKGLSENSSVKRLSIDGQEIDPVLVDKFENMVDGSHPHLTVITDTKVVTFTDPEISDDDGEEAIIQLFSEITNEFTDQVDIVGSGNVVLNADFAA